MDFIFLCKYTTLLLDDVMISGIIFLYMEVMLWSMRREDNVSLVCNIYSFLRPLPCLHKQNTVYHRHVKPATCISEVILDAKNKKKYKTFREASYLNDSLIN
jgi:hypothetical protein